MAIFCLQPKEVETARGERPSGEKRVVKLSKDVVKSRFWLVLNMSLLKLPVAKSNPWSLLGNNNKSSDAAQRYTSALQLLNRTTLDKRT